MAEDAGATTFGDRAPVVVDERTRATVVEDELYTMMQQISADQEKPTLGHQAPALSPPSLDIVPALSPPILDIVPATPPPTGRGLRKRIRSCRLPALEEEKADVPAAKPARSPIDLTIAIPSTWERPQLNLVTWSLHFKAQIANKPLKLPSVR